MSRHGPIEGSVDVENARYTADSGEDAVLLGEDGRARALVSVDAGVASGIARRPVLEQRVFQDCSEASLIPVHVV
jgi:hypothetical protein